MRWPRFHLSTAIVLMFAAGGLIWANVNERRVSERGHAWYPIGMPMHGDEMSESEFFTSHESNRYWHGNRGFEYGWPFNAARRMREVVIKRDGGAFISKPPESWHRGAIVENVLVAAGILIAIWLVCEWGIRRRAARKV